eukprot:Gb_06492 [translate_table: standard]
MERSGQQRCGARRLRPTKGMSNKVMAGVVASSNQTNEEGTHLEGQCLCNIQNYINLFSQSSLQGKSLFLNKASADSYSTYVHTQAASSCFHLHNETSSFFTTTYLPLGAFDEVTRVLVLGLSHVGGIIEERLRP